MSRTWLFVPGDDRAKAAKAFERTQAQVILDLEDAIGGSIERRLAGREMIRVFLPMHPAYQARCWIRVSSLRDPDADLEAAVAAGAAGVVLPKCEGPQAISAVDALLTARERMYERTIGATRIVAIPTETALGVQMLSDFKSPLPRLAGLMWGAEDLCADLGGMSPRTQGGEYAGPYALARDACLLAARAAQCTAIDAVFVDFKDAEGLARECRAHKGFGFDAKAAIHPAQVPVIDVEFSPTAEEQRWAARVLEAIPEGGGAASVDGVMVDAPHRRRALHILGLT